MVHEKPENSGEQKSYF